MTNITQVLRNLRRKGIENDNRVACPECGYDVDADYIFEQINEGEYDLLWEHKITKKNTNGEDVTVSEYKNYPKNSTHVPAYFDIHTWCRDSYDDDFNCEHSFTIRYHIIAQEII